MAEVRFCSSLHCVQNLDSGFLVRNCESIISKRNEVNIEIHKYKSRIEI